MPTDPRERCIALVQQALHREEIRERIRATLADGMAREVSFGKINGTLLRVAKLVVKAPKNIAWRIPGRTITLSLREIIDESDAELHRLLQQHSAIPSFHASESGPDHHTPTVTPVVSP